MKRCRALYIAAVAALLIFFLLYSGYLAVWLLISALLLPVLLLAGVWIASRFVTVEPARTVGRAQKGEKAVFEIEVRNRGILPLSGVRLQYRWCNQPGGEGGRGGAVLSLAAKTGARVRIETAVPHCGVMRLRLEKNVFIDWLGITAWRRRLGQSSSAVVFPQARCRVRRLRAGAPAGSLPQEGEARLSRGVSPDVIDVREYEPGDSPRAVHWKLTAKLNRLMVRQTGAQEQSLPVIVVQPSIQPPRQPLIQQPAAPDLADAVLECGFSLSLQMVEEGLPHAVCWGASLARPVLRRDWEQAFASAAAEWGAGQEDSLTLVLNAAPRPAAVVYVTAALPQEQLERLQGAAASGARVTVLLLAQEEGDSSHALRQSSGAVAIYSLSSARLQQELAQLTLQV